MCRLPPRLRSWAKNRELRKNTGQAARKPSYSLSMAKTQRANSQGAASTMLTGSGGVPTNQLALGRAQLLGGAAA